MFLNDVQQTDDGATQPEGILGPRHVDINGKESGQGVQLVGHRQQHTRRRLRQLTTGLTRHILFFNRRSYGRGFAVFRRINTAHGSLKLRKFHDHLGHQIGFREMCGAFDILLNGRATEEEFG